MEHKVDKVVGIQCMH